jgi:hypothetical protein
MNTQEFFAAIKDEAIRLTERFPSGFCYVTSLKNINRQSTAGTVAEVSTRIAARHLVENTGRISTDPEIAAHLAQGRSNAAQTSAMDYRHAKHGPVYVIAREKK